MKVGISLYGEHNELFDLKSLTCTRVCFNRYSDWGPGAP